MFIASGCSAATQLSTKNGDYPATETKAGPKKNAGHWFAVPASGSRLIFLRLLLRLVGLLVLPGLIPKRQFDPVPKAELVVDYAEIILDNVFGCAEGIRNFPVLAALGDELDDGMFSGVGSAGIDCLSDHSCLL